MDRLFQAEAQDPLPNFAGNELAEPATAYWGELFLLLWSYGVPGCGYCGFVRRAGHPWRCELWVYVWRVVCYGEGEWIALFPFVVSLTDVQFGRRWSASLRSLVVSGSPSGSSSSLLLERQGILRWTETLELVSVFYLFTSQRCSTRPTLSYDRQRMSLHSRLRHDLGTRYLDPHRRNLPYPHSR